MIKVAIQGYRGAFHQEAAESYFAMEIGIVECLTFDQLIDAMQLGKANYGVMAVENSLVGCILPNFVLLRESGLNIIGEVYLQISQNLMALPSQRIEELHEVQSHPMAILQCKPYLSKFPNINLIDSHDTALSAKHIAENNLVGVGAIGSRAAASIYGLEVIAPSIETHKENFTRFMVISPTGQSVKDNTPVKATIAFTANHEPGSLAKVLTSLAQEGVNLTMLQSLPVVGTAWEYIFHADLFYSSMSKARASISNLNKKVNQLWVLGVYPAENQKNIKKEKAQTLTEQN
jgi:prephenate dehydratase